MTWALACGLTSNISYRVTSRSMGVPEWCRCEPGSSSHMSARGICVLSKTQRLSLNFFASSVKRVDEGLFDTGGGDDKFQRLCRECVRPERLRSAGTSFG